MKHKILVIEDSKAMLTYEVETLQKRFDFEVISAMSYAEAEKILQSHENEFFIALADLVLPDAQNGEIVNLLLHYNVPPIVFTGQYNEKLRDFIIAKPIIDYILKDNLNNFEYALRLVACVYANQSMQVLVVDDSEYSRRKIEFSLQRIKMNVLHAMNVKEAKTMLQENPDIQLILTDYNMDSHGTGIELTAEIRQMYGSDTMAIIGFSRSTNMALPIEFLKKGANDFIPFDYSEEIFTLRVLNNLEMMRSLKEAKQRAITDYITGLYNRRYLLEVSEQYFHQVKRNQLQLGVVMIDIDFFKRVNDTYGHDIGDKVIVTIANILKKEIRKSDIVSRIGGEEFALLLIDVDDEKCLHLMEKISRLIENTPIIVTRDESQQEVHVTVSVGFTTKKHETITEALKFADSFLYTAKNSGRNCIRFEEKK